MPVIIGKSPDLNFALFSTTARWRRPVLEVIYSLPLWPIPRQPAKEKSRHAVAPSLIIGGEFMQYANRVTALALEFNGGIEAVSERCNALALQSS